jgi:hypothetical protein
MRWNEEEDTWSYRADISANLLHEMREINKEWADVFMDTLHRLAIKSPIPAGEGVIVYNPAEADPVYRMAKSIEQLTAAVNHFITTKG